VLEWFLFKSVGENEKDVWEIFGRGGRERERKGVDKSCFLDPPLYKTLAFVFNFLACKKLYKHISNKKDNKHHPKKSFAQIPK